MHSAKAFVGLHFAVFPGLVTHPACSAFRYSFLQEPLRLFVVDGSLDWVYATRPSGGAAKFLPRDTFRREASDDYPRMERACCTACSEVKIPDQDEWNELVRLVNASALREVWGQRIPALPCRCPVA